MNVQLKHGYKLLKIQTVAEMRTSLPNLARALEANGWAGSAIVQKGSAVYSCYVKQDGKTSRLLAVPQ